LLAVIVSACRGAKKLGPDGRNPNMLSTQAHESPTALAALASAFTGLATALILFTVLPSAAIGGEVVFTVASSAAIEAEAGRSHDPKAETGELVSQALATLSRMRKN